MQVFKTKIELTNYLNLLSKDKTVGFIPTMGALHEGHLSLIAESNKECNITLCSIFVNPTQFNNPEDFANYPNSLDEDLSQLKKANCTIVYTPQVIDVYNHGEQTKKFNFGDLANKMEGEYRPGHFDGMATIVEKFLNIIKPTKAFFGQKDLQQLQIVKALVNIMKLDIKIICVSTIREKGGLAKSSRNQLLSKQEKKEAYVIYQCLIFCKKNKNLGIKALKKYILNRFDRPASIKLEYAEFVDLNSMQPIIKWGKGKQNAICIAAYIRNVRLIDNIIL